MCVPACLQKQIIVTGAEVAGGGGGSLQDVRHEETAELVKRKANSDCNLRRSSISGECECWE